MTGISGDAAPAASPRTLIAATRTECPPRTRRAPQLQPLGTARPPLVLVAGGVTDPFDYASLAPWLEPRFSLWIIRRGPGVPTADGATYALETEFERLGAAIDAMDARVDAFACAFGATLLLGAMPLTRNLQRAVLYEPGAGVGPHADDGDHVGAGTFARERRAEAEWAFGPDSYRSLIPTLLIVGSDSPSRSHQATEIARAALPNSRVSLLDGQARSAPFTAPRLVAEHITWFLGREAAPLGDRSPPELGDEMEPAASRSRRSSPARRASSPSASRWP